MALVWPSQLPQAIPQNVSTSFPQLALRTPMDAGPAKVRGRFTAGAQDVSFSMVLDDQQADNLRDFFTFETSGGAETFDWRDPFTGDTVVYRFVSPPKLRAVSHDMWDAAIELERLP